MVADPTCSSCGDLAHPDRECRPQVAEQVADIVNDHPELASWAAMRIEIAELRDLVHTLTVEVHQWR